MNKNRYFVDPTKVQTICDTSLPMSANLLRLRKLTIAQNHRDREIEDAEALLMLTLKHWIVWN